MIEAVFIFLAKAIYLLKPLVVPLCFIGAWAIVALLGLSVWSFFKDGIGRAKQMHQIPCSNCRYFTADYHLKCPVRPTIALSESAINCTDYEERSMSYYS